MVGDDRLGNGGTNGVDLGGNSSTLDPNTDIEVRELVLSENQHRLKDLEAERLWLDVLNGLSVDLDQTTALLGECTSGGGLFPVIGNDDDGEVGANGKMATLIGS